jgi:hypothetical protein
MSITNSKAVGGIFQRKQTKIECVVFADVCKYGSGMPLSARLFDLQNENLMQNIKKWKVIGASPTYNPLGTYLTFLSVDDIVSSVSSLIQYE